MRKPTTADAPRRVDDHSDRFDAHALLERASLWEPGDPDEPISLQPFLGFSDGDEPAARPAADSGWFAPASPEPPTGGVRPAAERRPSASFLGDYRLLSLLGRGGMGEVWEAQQQSLGRSVALKRLRWRDPTDSNPVAQPPPEPMIVAFRQEAAIMARLEHPSILTIHDTFLDDQDAPVMVMKLVRGEPWSRIMAADRGERTTSEYLVRHLGILLRVSQAVAFAHSRGIVHRDLKPSQVLLGEYGETQLFDWGLALSMSYESVRLKLGDRVDEIQLPTPDDAPNPAGTPALMAPEQTQFGAAEIGPWTDVFQLGGMLYHLLTGTFPHDAPTPSETLERAFRGEVEHPADRIARRAPEREEAGEASSTGSGAVTAEAPLPTELVDLVMAALQPDRTRRLESAREFADRLQAYLEGSTRAAASRRLLREAVQMFAAQPSEMDDVHATYMAAFQRLDRARELWPDNIEARMASARARYRYARHALMTGDLRLAQSLCDRLDDSVNHVQLAREIDAARTLQAQKERRSEDLRTALFFSLIALVCVLGVSAYWLWNANLEARRRQGITDNLSAHVTLQNRQIALERDRAQESKQLALRHLQRGQQMIRHVIQGIAHAMITSPEVGEQLDALIRESIVQIIDVDYALIADAEIEHLWLDTIDDLISTTLDYNMVDEARSILAACFAKVRESASAAELHRAELYFTGLGVRIALHVHDDEAARHHMSIAQEWIAEYGDVLTRHDRMAFELVRARYFVDGPDRDLEQARLAADHASSLAQILDQFHHIEDAYRLRARIHSELEEYDQAVTVSRQLLDLMAPEQRQGLMGRTIRRNIASNLTAADRHAEAAAEYRILLRNALLDEAEGSVAVIAYRSYLGRSLVHSEQSIKALVTLQIAREQAAEVLGEDHILYLNILQTTGLAQLDQEQYDEAAASFQQGAETALAEYGPVRLYREFVGGLIEALVASDRHVEARTQLAAALEQKADEFDDPKVAAGWDELVAKAAALGIRVD